MDVLSLFKNYRILIELGSGRTRICAQANWHRVVTFEHTVWSSLITHTGNRKVVYVLVIHWSIC